jgi:hypothetical protein
MCSKPYKIARLHMSICETSSVVINVPTMSLLMFPTPSMYNISFSDEHVSRCSHIDNYLYAYTE